MTSSSKSSATIFGCLFFAAIVAFGYQIQQTAINYKLLDRTVTVKGLAEQEFAADTVIWPIQFTAASNDLDAIYLQIDKQSQQVKQFLLAQGLPEASVTISPPSVNDKLAQQYGNGGPTEFRYTALQTITVYTQQIDVARAAISQLSQLGKQGIVFAQNNYDMRIEYIFSKLNDVKPQMVEESTKNARIVAQKFATDSDSQLGKIKRARQGQFSISNRDKNTPHIKRVRVVSTVEYYLAD
ncbi:SIMPL domain-containing protein [Shewanella sp. WXL01]|uniref:SIMPL domain-containing protein n=1 Tax=Shewanella maritima TaxID=2520507 RepID=A0A411PLZ1_9GAMM|nr:MULTISPECIES: SIMPL domain-containing protein [Shewanella]NKF51550.1 SIMPL domain-containing protein [Shewanella sp. WXL01]QBF84525.1 SIMPL domain-containing protein [Shewanella maritima]